MAARFVRMGRDGVIDFREANPDCPIWNRKLIWLSRSYAEKQELEARKLIFLRRLPELCTNDPNWYNQQLKYLTSAFDSVDELLRPGQVADRSQRPAENWEDFTPEEAERYWASAWNVDPSDPEYKEQINQALEELKENFPVERELQMPSGKFVHLEDVDIIAETDSALLLQYEGENYWIPKSQMADPDDYEKGQTGRTVSITQWIADKRGIEGERD